MKATLILGIVLFTCSQAYTQNQLLSTGPVFAGGLGILNTSNNIHQLNVYSTTGGGQIGMGGTAPALNFYSGIQVPFGAPLVFSQPYTKIGLATGANHFINGATSGDFVIQNVTQSKSIIFSSYFNSGNGVEHMRLSSAGQLLIGTTASLSKFHVESSGLLPGVTISNSTGYALAVNDNTGGKFAIWPTGALTIGNTNIVPIAKLNVNVNGAAQAINVYDDAAINPNDKVTFAVQNSGYTEIGPKSPTVNSPNTMLTVYGKIVASEILVIPYSSWADYVFSSNYKLKPLNEVEKFIKENHHLPNVPSAATIEKDGANLGELSVIQMEKIEELTLYIIELEKRLKLLEAKNTAQR